MQIAKASIRFQKGDLIQKNIKHYNIPATQKMQQPSSAAKPCSPAGRKKTPPIVSLENYEQYEDRYVINRHSPTFTPH